MGYNLALDICFHIEHVLIGICDLQSAGQFSKKTLSEAKVPLLLSADITVAIDSIPIKKNIGRSTLCVRWNSQQNKEEYLQLSN